MNLPPKSCGNHGFKSPADSTHKHGYRRGWRRRYGLAQAMQIQSLERRQQLGEWRPLPRLLHGVLHAITIVETCQPQGVLHLALAAVHVVECPL